MSDNKNDDAVVRFYVENPEWTFGKKLVVMAVDYDKLAAENAVLRKRNEQLQEQRDEWERAARIQRNTARLTVVKATPGVDARGLPINPTKLGGGPYEP